MTNEITKSTEKTASAAKAQPSKLYGRGKSRVQKGLVYAAAVITFAVLLFLIAYILINGIPNLKPSLFEWTYNSDNVSMMPAIITTIEMTLLALVIAVPAWLLGKQFEVIGGPVFAILIGMVLALVVPERAGAPLQSGIKFTSKKVFSSSSREAA